MSQESQRLLSVKEWRFKVNLQTWRNSTLEEVHCYVQASVKNSSQWISLQWQRFPQSDRESTGYSGWLKKAKVNHSFKV